MNQNSETIRNLFYHQKLELKSRARYTALAAAVKIEEPSEIRIISEWLSDITEQPTCVSTFDPSV